jgi:hypothetical protein
MSSKELTSSKDSYGPPLPKNDKQIVVGSSPTYISKITSPSSSSGTGAQTVLVSPSQFNQRITASQKSSGSPLAYYSPPPLERTNFITKEIALPIIPLESYYCPEGSSLLQITSKIFPPGFWFLPKDLSKTREYYEFILVDSDSITLTHKRENSSIKFSKFKINKVLSPSDWGMAPYTKKSFSRVFSPQHYNYFDYMDAWSFFLHLLPYEHTWFIWFNKKISLSFPNWFVQWFEVYGLNKHILPDYALQAFERFSQSTTCPRHKSLLAFCAVFGITWITAWSFATQQIWADCSGQELVKKIKIKWWVKFNPALLNSKVLDEWFKNNPSKCKGVPVLEESPFLANKAKLMASLSSTSDPKEFFEKLQEAMSTVSGSDGESATEEQFQENEDDCYGIID